MLITKLNQQEFLQDVKAQLERQYSRVMTPEYVEEHAASIVMAIGNILGDYFDGIRVFYHLFQE